MELPARSLSFSMASRMSFGILRMIRFFIAWVVGVSKLLILLVQGFAVKARSALVPPTARAESVLEWESTGPGQTGWAQSIREWLVERTGSMGASKRRTLLLVLLLLTLASAAQAQLWRGPAAIEVRAEDKGKPAAGGEVRLEFLDMEPPAGPAPVKLDSRGRAVVGSLAEGRWRVEVSREGAMTYRAEVLVRRDGKPDVIEAVQHNVPGAISMMEVKLARSRGGAAPPPQTPQPQEVPVAAAEPLRPAPVPDRATPKPEPTVEERPAPRPAQPQPAPPVAPATPPVQERPAPIQSTPAPAPSQAPPVVHPSTPPPAAPTVPSAPSVPAGSVLRRSFQDRTCVECRPGESSLSMEVVATPSVAGCGDGLRDSLTRLDTAAMGGGCHLFRIDLPKNARFVGYRYEVQDGSQGSDCLAGKDCPSGGRWPMDPVLRRDAAGTTTVATAFENRGDRERRAVLTVYFKEGGGADAPRPMIPSKPKNSGL
jgi:hypothetical protein